jgi:predicted TIM-barrel fold metal-dependent hydrolase
MTTKPYRIDIHHHILPPEYISSLKSVDITSAGNVPFPKWDLENTLSAMNNLGIATAITSISSPGIYFGDTDFTLKLARKCNEFSADLIRNNSQRFGAFAVLPLPNIKASIDELTYTLDELKLDGVALLSNINGHYLGDPKFNELYAELNRRKCVVNIHPNTPSDDKLPMKDARAAVLEFVFDTTRAVANMLYNGTLKKYPDIRFIVPHAGGTVPYIAWRITMGNRRAIESLKNLYYDTALSATPYALRSLQELAPSSHILFGSDYPFLPKTMISSMIKGLKDYNGFDDKIRKAIECENAKNLFLRFRNDL